MKAQLRTAHTEIESLQRRNQDLEMLVKEKEYLLQDVIQKFKKERTSLKSRILKLETRMNQMTYDAQLDMKPAKVSGTKSVQQSDLISADCRSEADFGAKSELQRAQQEEIPVKGKKRSSNDDGLDRVATKQEKYES